MLRFENIYVQWYQCFQSSKIQNMLETKFIIKLDNL